MPLTRRRKIVIGLIFSLALSVVVALSLLFQPPPEGMILIDAEGYSTAMGIDNDGRVMGDISTLNGSPVFFIWSAEKGVTVFKEGENLKGEWIPQEINDLGQRIENVGSGTNMRAYVIHKNGKRHELSLLGGDGSYAAAINNKGQIVGFVTVPLPWWKRWWNEVANKLDLPKKYMFLPFRFSLPKAAIWTVPPESD